MHFWTARFGYSETAVRMPAAVFGAFGILATFLLVRRLFGNVAALVAASIIAFSPFHIYYSQETRCYTLFFLLAVLSCHALVRVLDTGGWRPQLGYVAATALLPWTHLFAVFVIAAQFVGVLIRLRHRPPAAITLDRFLNLCGVALLFFLPWLPTVARWIHGVSAGFWIPPFGPEILPQAFGAYAGSYAVLILAVALAIVAWRRAPPNARWQLALLTALAILPVLLPVLISWLKRPVFYPRYGIPALAGLAALAGAGLAFGPPKWRIGASAALALTLIVGLLFPIPAPPTPDWRAAVNYVYAQQPDATVILNTSYDDYTWRYYADRREDPGPVRSWKQSQAGVDHAYLVSDVPPARFLDAGQWTIVHTRAFGVIRIDEIARAK